MNKILKIDQFGFNRKEELPKEYINDIVSDLNTEKFIEGLLNYAVSQKADFIFFTPSEKDILISFRIFQRSYQIMKIELSTLFSIVSKLKFFSDIDIFKKTLINEGSFKVEVLGKIYNIFLTIVHTDYGESISLEISDNKNFKTNISSLSERQKNIFLNSIKKESGFFTIFDNNKISKKETLYTFLESDINKNKEVYSFEIDPVFNLSYVKQISTYKNENLLPVFEKIIKTNPETIAVEDISKTSIPTLFNYVNFSKKIIYSSELKIENFIENILNFDFHKGLLVKNLSTSINSFDFKKINNETKKKYLLKKTDVELIKSFFKKDEIKEILEKEKINLLKTTFYTNKIKINKKNISQEKIGVKGVFNLGLTCESLFLEKQNIIEIKNNINKESKKSILENAIIAAAKGLLDIKDILKFLKK